jgi:hypothetical protein
VAIKSKEICRRVRVLDGAVTFHVVTNEGKLTQVAESTFRDYEARAFRTDCLHGRNDKQFQRAFKTVYFY